ncbi:MAG: enoyl-CoA hydratase/isomerase family protein [Gemmatimonadaceae bacterium]
MKRLVCEEGAGVANIILSRPEKKNALDRVAADELALCLEHIGQSPTVRVVLITAEGNDFCAGADLEALSALRDATPDQHRADAQALGDVFVAIRNLPQPVVAGVQGHALAGGCGLANACDIALAHENARFGYPEVRVGFVPAMVMTMLRRSAGEKRAFELVATGRLIDAREAESIGLITRVVPAASFKDEVEQCAAQLAELPPEAVRLTKRLFYESEGKSFTESLAAGVAGNAEARATTAFKEGIARFSRRGEKP